MKSIFTDKCSSFSTICVPIGQYECRYGHPDVHKFPWCEVDHKFDDIVSAFVVERIKNGRVGSKLLIGCLIVVADMLFSMVPPSREGVDRRQAGIVRAKEKLQLRTSFALATPRDACALFVRPYDPMLLRFYFPVAQR